MFQRTGETSWVICTLIRRRWRALWSLLPVTLRDRVKLLPSTPLILLVNMSLMASSTILKPSWNEWPLKPVSLTVSTLSLTNIIPRRTKLGLQWNICMFVCIVLKVQRSDVVQMTWRLGCDGSSSCILILCSMVRCSVVNIVLLGTKQGSATYMCLAVVRTVLIKNSE